MCAVSQAQLAAPSAKSEAPETKFTDRQRRYWAFQEVVKPQVPNVKTGDSSNLLGCFHFGQIGAKGDPSESARRQDHAASARHTGPDGSAAVAGRRAGLSVRSFAGRFREGCRPPARLAAIRRALGPPLARPRALRRHWRLQRRCGAAGYLAIPRLRDPVVQRGQAVRPFRPRADRRRRTVSTRSGREDGDGVQPAFPEATRRAGG